MTEPVTGARDRELVRAQQLAQLRHLVVRCAANPFYGPRLRAAGLTAGTVHDLADLRRVEPVDKSDILADQEAAPPFGTRLGVAPDEVREIHLTSGTSGIGQEAMGLTDDDVAGSAATWGPIFTAAGLGPGDLFATFYPATLFAYGRSVLSGSRAFGVPVVSMSGVDRDVALALMRRLQPRAIGARPALFALLAEQLDREGVTPSDAFPALRSMIMSGISPAHALRLQHEWGAVVHEVYGMSQAAGIIAATGPQGAVPGGEPGVMCCNERLFVVEAVHPVSLAPVEEGEAELLLTCLDRVASPIVRFRTRDRVTVVPAGSSANPSPMLGLRVGSIGRWDDMLKLRGNNVWPSQLDEAILGVAGVVDYLATVTLDQRGVEQLGIAVNPLDPSADDAAELAALLARRVKARTNVRPTITFDPTLPPPEAKPKRLLDRRHQ